jgi:hypothetical protein
LRRDEFPQESTTFVSSTMNVNDQSIKNQLTHDQSSSSSPTIENPQSGKLQILMKSIQKD